MLNTIEDRYITLADDHDVKGVSLLDTVKTEYGHRAAYVLVKWIGEGDFTYQSLFLAFRLTTLVRASYSAKIDLYAVDTDFLSALGHKAFWELTRNQQIRLKEQLLWLWPEKFHHLRNWT